VDYGPFGPFSGGYAAIRPIGGADAEACARGPDADLT